MASVYVKISNMPFPDWFRAIALNIDRNFDALKSAITSALRQNSLATSSITSGNDWAQNIGNLHLRGGNKTIVSGSNTVSFIQPLTTNTYQLSRWAKNSGGDDIGLSAFTFTQGGFSFTAADSGTLYYIATEVVP